MAVDVPALVLCAGLGTRLRPLTYVRAKPAIPVAGQPMVRRIAGWLAEAGVRDLVLNLHHLPESIASVVGDGSDLGVRARYSWEQPEVLGSAGGPRQALDILGARTFLLVNGDTLTDFPIAGLLASHEASGAVVTMAVVPNREPRRYGGVRLSRDGSVLGFVRAGSPEPSWHFVGLQAADRRAFEGLPAGRPANSVGELYDELIAGNPGCIRGHVGDAAFWDVGTIADYLATSRAFTGASTSPAMPAPADSTIVDSVVWDRVHFGSGCRVERCIVTDDVQVPAGATFRDAVLLRHPVDGIAAIPLTTSSHA